MLGSLLGSLLWCSDGNEFDEWNLDCKDEHEGGWSYEWYDNANMKWKMKNEDDWEKEWENGW